MIFSSSISRANKNIYNNSAPKYIYSFDEGDKNMIDLLGGKGANLSEMNQIGIPVPFGFTITTEVCEVFLKEKIYPEGFAQELESKLQLIENKTGKKFGNKENPLLVSVRSGAKVSMPGMMDTVLNLGLNDETVVGLAEKTNNERFSHDSYRRFIQMFGNVVLGIKHELFDEALHQEKINLGIENDFEIPPAALKNLIIQFKDIILQETGKQFPQNPFEQLKFAIESVFRSWNNDRAIAYRQIHQIHGVTGTAVTIQAMVFGNMGNESGTGVAFTRNPSNGQKEFFGEFLMNAQGEDVVAGIRTPIEIKKLTNFCPEAYLELIEIKEKLEKHYKDMQDIEFTIEKGKLYLLQTRVGKRTAAAALQIAIDLEKEKILSKQEALMTIDAKQLGQLLHPQIKNLSNKTVLAVGLPASPGAATGKIAFTAEEAIDMATNHNEKVILVRKETSPEDILGMNCSEGILTSTGGMTSHAAVVCRGMGKTCISGCSQIIVDTEKKQLKIGNKIFSSGDKISLDGSTGEVILGEIEMEKPEISDNFREIMNWANQSRRLQVRANADTPEDSKIALDFGAEGIGLCRTEHMFFEENRINIFRKTILASTPEDRKKFLDELLEIQKGDFIKIFRTMKGLPVTVRLLDPPLHEFLPSDSAKISKLAKDLKLKPQDLENQINNLHEVNPMLGHRGCRLGITFPDIYIMQVHAIIQAGIHLTKEGITPEVEIEIPLVGHINEFNHLKDIITQVIDSYQEQITFKWSLGTMIEVPRACLTADEIANSADFFSFGTNDLTQMVCGLSRDDSGKFMGEYLKKGIFHSDPMSTIDVDGVGKLMRLAVDLARGEKPTILIGICGEQGGDPLSVSFCHKIGLDYVSCSPYRIPVAILAAAQANISADKKKQ